MQSGISIYRVGAEAETSFGLASHHFSTDSYSFGERAGSFLMGGQVYKFTSTQPEEEDWDNPETSAGVECKIQSAGGLTFIVAIMDQTDICQKLFKRHTKSFEWRKHIHDQIYANASFSCTHRWSDPVLPEQADTLASTLVKVRKRTNYGLSQVSFGRTEDGVESLIFLSTLSRLERTKKERAAARYVYSHFYRLRMAEDYQLCDRILSDVDTDRLTPVVLIALLTITAPIKKRLKNRAGFYNRVRKSIELMRGSDVTNQLLAGLE